MRGDGFHIHKALLPLSWLYGIGVQLRNMMFNIGILKQRSFDVPVISVGNITVGGTGKTPHVEYLVDLLRSQFRVAVLSRGYKRSSRGFVLAGADTHAADIGDEPYQIKQKFPDVTVAVDKKRCHGIDELMALDCGIDVILLDDAYQHRYVKPGINILLVDYHRLIIDDCLLPAGRLREPLSGKNRADIVIVTKCPKELKPMDYRVVNKSMDLFPYQKLFFTSLEYGTLKPVFAEGQHTAVPDCLKSHHVLLMTGIASPRLLADDLKPQVAELTPLTFGDHHSFTANDVHRINEAFTALPSPRCIVTTEKDAARLEQVEGLSSEVRSSIYSLPIKICFLLEQVNIFNNQIIGYVQKNSRNSILVKRKDDHKSQDSHRAGDRPRTISFRNN